jgi:hypothetical protein
VCLLISVCINTNIVGLGFGTHIETVSHENLVAINLQTIIVAAFGLLSSTLSKTSFCLTLYRIANAQWMKWFLVFIIVTVNISMNLVWIFGLAKCTPFQKVLDSKVAGHCWDKKKLVQFQLFAAYYSAALDFVLAVLPWKILMGMSMLRRERLGVAVAMSLGAIAGATAIVKSVLVVNMTSPDITYDRVDLTIWTMAEPAASIMAISIPILRMLYRELRSSNRSYFKRTKPSVANADPEQNMARKSQRYNNYSKYGDHSVVIMTNATWRESEEALQDPGSTSGHRDMPNPHAGGVLQTKEVIVNYEDNNGSSMDEVSIELANLPPAATKGP